MVLLPEAKNSRKEPTRKPPKKVPSYHLTGSKSMEFIKEADATAKEKEEKERKTDLVKKEAVRQLRTEERKAKTKGKK